MRKMSYEVNVCSNDFERVNVEFNENRDLRYSFMSVI